MIRKVASSTLHGKTLARAVDLLEVVDRPLSNFLRVLTYHRIVGENEDTSFSPGMAVRLSVFQQQMAYLADQYHVLNIHELLEAARAGTRLPARSVLITFDDAYQDFADLAWPVLKDHGLPATLFVPTSFPDHPERGFWWDWLSHAFQATDLRDDLETPMGRLSLSTRNNRISAYKTVRDYVKSLPHAQALSTVEQVCRRLGVPRQGLAVLDWDALRALSREGVSLGAHTRTHPLLNNLSEAEMTREICGSFADLWREVGYTPPVFAYPGGELNEEVFSLLQFAGIELAFSTQRGINNFGKVHHHLIRRINVGQNTSLTALRLQLLQSAQKLYSWL